MSQFRDAFSHIKALPSAFWVIIGATLINQVGNMVIVFLVLYLNQQLGFSLAKASFAFAIFSAGMLITGLLGGSLIDRVGAGKTMVGTLFINGIILLFFPFIHVYTTILFFCLIWGFSFGLYRPASQTFVSYLSRPGMHKVTFSLYRLSLNLGMSIGPMIGGILAGYSFASIFIVNAIANLLTSLIITIGLIQTAWINYRPVSEHKMELSIKWLTRDSVLRLFVLGMIPVSMIFFQCESTLAVFLKKDLHFSLSFYGLLFTLNTLMIVLFELPLNIATINWSYRIHFMLGSLLITMGFAGLYFATLTWHMLLLTVFWTLGEMILFPSSSSYIADIAPPAHRGSYMALYSTCSNLGMLLGPLSGAMIMEQFGASYLWLSCGAWGMLSVIIFYYLKEKNKTSMQ